MKLAEIEKQIAEQLGKNGGRSLFPIDNLQDKNIKDFTTEDTIYITVPESQGHTVTFLCQFLSYEGGMVTGRVLVSTVNCNMYNYDVERKREVSARLPKVSLYGQFEEDSNTRYHHCNVLGNFRDKIAQEDGDAETLNNHESYGLVRFSRGSTSGNIPLFGSSIKHNNIITLTIAKASVDRHLGREWTRSERDLIEVDMSSAQFAELISSFNRGEGTPCTIRNMGGKRLQPPPFESRVQKSQEEFTKKMKNMAIQMQNMMAEATEILEGKKAVSKGEKEHILSSIRSLKQQMENNVPFITSSFAEQMDKTVEEAKLEFENFAQRRVQELGLPTGDYTQLRLAENTDEE